MPKDSYEDNFDKHRRNYRKREKLRLLDDLQGQFADEDVDDLLRNQNGSRRWIMVTADRAWQDNAFDYGYWDMVLSLLSRFGGRPRILKPLHQLRVIQWRRSRADLLSVFKVVRANPAVAYGSLLVLPYIRPVVADDIDPSGWI